MAASLESIDDIRDRLIERGLGTSKLASQAIQRQNLPNLSRSLITQNAIRSRSRFEKELRNKIMALKSNIMDVRRKTNKSFNVLGSGRPFAIGMTEGSAYSPKRVTIVVPTGNGQYELRSVAAEAAGSAPLAEKQAVESKVKNLLSQAAFPTRASDLKKDDVAYAGSKPITLGELRAKYITKGNVGNNINLNLSKSRRFNIKDLF